MLFELPHKIGLAVVSAGLGYGSYRKVGVFQKLRRMDKTALYDVLSERNAECLEIQAVEVCPAYLHILAHFLHWPACSWIVVHSLTQLFQLGITRYILLRINIGAVCDIAHGNEYDTHGELHELAEMLSAVHGLRPHRAQSAYDNEIVLELHRDILSDVHRTDVLPVGGRGLEAHKVIAERLAVYGAEALLVAAGKQGSRGLCSLLLNSTVHIGDRRSEEQQHRIGTHFTA